MNEMYAGKGVEQTFSFLHLSLQEYLAAWHLAHSYSVAFQVAYHRLAAEAYLHSYLISSRLHTPRYTGDNEGEKAFLSSLLQQRPTLVEPAIFLAGITSWRCQPEDGKNPWETYLCQETGDIEDSSVLLQSLYEAQNPAILTHYFVSHLYRKKVQIGASFRYASQTPYDCYALSYCVAYSCDQFRVFVTIRSSDEVSLVETFVKGLADHHQHSTPRIKYKKMELNIKDSDKCVFWITKSNFLAMIEEMEFESFSIDNSLAQDFFGQLVHLTSLRIHITSTIGEKWDWLETLNSLSKLKALHIYSNTYTIQWKVDPEALLDINFPVNGINNPTDTLVHIVLKSIFQSNSITKATLPNISRKTMLSVRTIILDCPNLATLELKRSRLGYDGILYICSALRTNTTLKHLMIHDDTNVPLMRQKRRWGKMNVSCFVSTFSTVSLPGKTTCTEFLLELNDILKDNTTLKKMKIECGLFVPVSAGREGEYCRWTGLGPLQQFNVGTICSGMSSNLRRSFSLSDLEKPKTVYFWDKHFLPSLHQEQKMIDLKKLFLKKKRKRISFYSFTAPDTEVVQLFSCIDYRLKECLEISHHHHVKEIKESYCWMLREVERYIG